MLLTLENAQTDKLQLITSAAGSIDVITSIMERGDASPYTVGAAKTLTNNITTAATTDIVAVPGAGLVRTVKALHVRNKSTTVANDVTVQLNRNATLVEAYKATLQPGDQLEYVEGVGFYLATSAAKLDTKLRVAADVINSTTSFADITGLTCNVISGKQYAFEAHLYHIAAATTTGVQFGIGGVTMTAM